MPAADPHAAFCPHCRTAPGETCTNDTGPGVPPHAERVRPARIRDIRAEVHRLGRELADRRAELARLLYEAGRRPGDGSDQPTLFGPDAQPRLW